MLLNVTKVLQMGNLQLVIMKDWVYVLALTLSPPLAPVGTGSNGRVKKITKNQPFKLWTSYKLQSMLR